MRTLRRELVRNRTMHLMVLPAILFFILFSYIPMSGIYLAFTRFRFSEGLFGSPFVGLDNFRVMWETGLLWKLTRNTVLYNVAFVVIGNVLQVFTAILLSELASKRFKKWAQSALFLPYFISYVLVGVFVFNLLNYDFGVVNSLLSKLGEDKIDFYMEPVYWIFIIILAFLWKSIGYGSVVYLAAITSLDREYYEAAEIDGATALQQIRFITLPLLMPTFIILILFSLGQILRGQFDLFYQLVGTNGYLFDTTDIIDTFVYRTLRHTFEIGVGSAIGVYQSVFGLLLIVTVNALIKRYNKDYALF